LLLLFSDEKKSEFRIQNSEFHTYPAAASAAVSLQPLAFSLSLKKWIRYPAAPAATFFCSEKKSEFRIQNSEFHTYPAAAPPATFFKILEELF
jgi:hypothetical protein